MTSRASRDVWPSLVEKAVCNGVALVHHVAHSHTVSEAYGRLRFPRLVRQQSVHLGLMTYLLLSETQARIYSNAFPPPCRVLEHLTVPPQCAYRVDT